MAKKIIIIFIFIIVVAVGYFLWKFYNGYQNNFYEDKADISLKKELKYVNYKFGYSIIIPENWEGKYFIEEKEDIVNFIYNSSSGFKHNLFSIFAYPIGEWEKIKKEPGFHGNEIASKENLVFVYAISLDNPYVGQEGDEYQKMASDINAIVETFNF